MVLKYLYEWKDQWKKLVADDASNLKEHFKVVGVDSRATNRK